MENLRTYFRGRLNTIMQVQNNAEIYPLIDGLRVMHDGNEAAFSDQFDSRFHGGWGSSLAGLHNTAQRLLAIMDAEDLKRELFPASVAGDALLPTFTLGEVDRERMLKLASDIRKIVRASTAFDEPHKVRLLNRIAAMENETHKKKGVYDVFLGALSDFGEVAGKFGGDIKPLTDRVKEMVGIARENTAAYDQLPGPEDLKGLPSPEEN